MTATGKTVALPILDSPHESEGWIYGLHRQGIGEEVAVAALVDAGSAVARLRAAELSTLLGDYAAGMEHATCALRLAETPEIEAFAKALVARNATEIGSRARGHLQSGEAFASLEAVRCTLNDLRSRHPKSSLALEAQFNLHLTLSRLHIAINQFAEAEREASEAAILASSLGLTFGHRAATRAIVHAMRIQGKLAEGFVVLEHLLGTEVYDPYEPPLQGFLLADTLYTLGDHGKAIAMLSGFRETLSDPNFYKSVIVLYEASCGIGGLEEDFETNNNFAGTYRWLLEALRHLMLVGASHRNSDFDKERARHLRAVIQLTQRGAVVSGPWQDLMERWLRGIAHLWLGEIGLAGFTVADSRIEAHEWLDIRLLMAGLRLELALNISDPTVITVRRSEEDLRQVFSDAVKLPLASRSGLAKRLMRWHPLAAAYGAVMPNPIRDLMEARESILRLGRSSTVYDIKLPHSFAAECILRAFGFDSRRGSFAMPRLNTVMLKQKDLLRITYGRVPYVRPVVSGAQLCLGLMKSAEGKAGYVEAARNVEREFGLVPSFRSDYGKGQLERIDCVIQGLLSGVTSLKEAVTAVLEA